MLQIKKLNVNVENKEVLKNFNLEIKDGSVHVIMGPNGVGKSTLSRVIMGDKNYVVTDGNIIFNGEDITKLTPDIRSKMGIFLAMQDPTVIEGVTNSEFLKTAKKELTGKNINYFDFIKGIDSALEDLEFDGNMIHRHINKGFSGGEKKKNEVLQIKVLKPKFIILDEIDSGLDVDSLKIVCKNINEYLKENKDTSLLIITHYPRILEYIKPDYVHIMNNGKIEKTGNFKLALEIEKNGYTSINEVSENNQYE